MKSILSIKTEERNYLKKKKIHNLSTNFWQCQGTSEFFSHAPFKTLFKIKCSLDK